MRFPSSAPVPQQIPEALESPLPGGISAVVRFFFQVPQWIQIGGALLGAVVALVVAVALWRRRRGIVAWIAARERGVKVALAAGVGVLLLAGVVAAGAGYNYIEHDNAFCTGCHVMEPAFLRFDESEHSQLGCHDCHQQPMSASLRQLYLWVLERPEEIGDHAPVPDRVCVHCHITVDADETWQRISATAGHRLHMRSEDEALADVQCVTCHGQEVHRFVPAAVTCGQSGCHSEAETRIELGRMSAEEGAIHCVACHQFTAPIVELGPVAEAPAAMIPAAPSCLACHDMQRIMTDLDVESEPHDAVCGACHNPHTQLTPEAAFETCTSAGCHSEPEAITVFHRGIHLGVLSDCGACHAPHSWRVDGLDCRACHATLP